MVKVFIVFAIIVYAFAVSSTAQTSQQTSTTPAAMSGETNLTSDAQIAEVMETVNQGEVKVSELAQKKSTDSGVKDFALMMVEAHKENNKDSKALTKSLKLSPKESALSDKLEKTAEQNLKELKSLKGSAFDQAYANKTVAMHQQVLTTLDQTLIPNAKNPELKAHLEKTRPLVSMHLEHAKDLQRRVSKAAPR